MLVEEYRKKGWRIPEFMNDEGLGTLLKGYLKEGEDPYAMYQRVVNGSSKRLKNLGWKRKKCQKYEKDMMDVLWKGFLGLATPVATDMGAEGEGLPISCYTVSVDDDMADIMDTLAETAMLTKYGGGVGCLDSETEYLTPEGWKKFSDYVEGDLVAQYDIEKDMLEFVKPSTYIKLPSEYLYHLKNQYGIDAVFCENHEHLTYYERNNKLTRKTYTTKEILDKHNSLTRGFRDKFKNAVRGISNNNLDYTEDELRFIVALQADGNLCKQPNTLKTRFSFKEKRKIERLEKLLNILGYKYTKKEINHPKKGRYTNFYVWSPEKVNKKNFPAEFYKLSSNQLSVISKEVTHWDGNRLGCYSTSVKSNADFVQFANTVSGYRSSIVKYEREGVLPEYRVFKTTNQFTSLGLDVRSTIEKVKSTNGFKYCFEMPKGTLITRYNDTIILTRNCSLGKIRGRGAKIHSTGGASNGVVPFARFFDEVAFGVSKGNVRRGSYALYLPIYHPDIKELLKAKDHTQGDSRRWIDSNIAVVVPDWWWKEMLAGDPEKIEILELVIKTRKLSGSPYILFIDAVNEANPEAYKKHGLKVEASNLCFKGDTEVLLADGTREKLSVLYDKQSKGVPIKVKSYNISELRDKNAVIKYNGLGKLIRLKMTDGSTIDCTPDHLFMLGNGFWCEAKNLKDRFIKTTKEKYCVRVYEIEELKGVHDLYDISVEDYRNYFVYLNNSSDIYTCVHNCSEIVLFTDGDHTFVCCLSSLGLNKYPEIKEYRTPNLGWTVPYISTVFLDSVLEEFICKAMKLPEGYSSNEVAEDLEEWLRPPFNGMPKMESAVRSAVKGRPLGLGSMGLGDLYQRLMLPFGSEKAKALNIEIHKFIYKEAKKASRDLAKWFGEPNWCKDTGYRNTHNLSCAPTRSNSAIANQGSQGIEPKESNYFVSKQDKNSTAKKNPRLKELLAKKGKDTPEVWKQINDDFGSVRKLDFLSDYEKDVFLTAREINQMDLVDQAADRQPYIDQAQSLNLFFHTYASDEHVLKVHHHAWRRRVKSLYYYRTRSKQTLPCLNILVTKDDCPFCVKIKELLKQDNVHVDIMNVKEARNQGIFKENFKTVPQLFLDGKFIGGYTEYVEYRKDKDTMTTSYGKYNLLPEGFDPVYSADYENECTACQG